MKYIACAGSIVFMVYVPASVFYTTLVCINAFLIPGRLREAHAMRRKLSFPLLALIAGLAFLPPVAPARAVVPEAPRTASLAGQGRTASTDTAVGALAAIGCGFFVRVTLVTGGTQVGTIVGAVACCGYMLFDAFVVDPHVARPSATRRGRGGRAPPAPPSPSRVPGRRAVGAAAPGRYAAARAAHRRFRPARRARRARVPAHAPQRRRGAAEPPARRLARGAPPARRAPARRPRSPSRLESWLARRAAHEPVQYITGRAAFRDLDLAVDPRVLIPRPETEGLVEAVLEVLRAEAARWPAPRVLDLGTGSGAIALALAAEWPAAVRHRHRRERRRARGRARQRGARSGSPGASASSPVDWFEAVGARRALRGRGLEPALHRDRRVGRAARGRARVRAAAGAVLGRERAGRRARDRGRRPRATSPRGGLLALELAETRVHEVAGWLRGRSRLAGRSRCATTSPPAALPAGARRRPALTLAAPAGRGSTGTAP